MAGYVRFDPPTWQDWTWDLQRGLRKGQHRDWG
jgi:hypothetical protein